MSEPKHPSADSPVDFGRVPFEFAAVGPIGTLKLIGEIGPDLVKEFEKRLRSAVEAFEGDLLLDLSECTGIHPSWTRPLMAIAANTKKNGKRLRVASTSVRLKSFFQDQGIGPSFPFAADVATATRELTAKKSPKIDVAFINPFLESTIEVLRKQASTTAKAGAIGARDANAPIDGDVSGVLGLTGESFAGSLILSFPEATHAKLVASMVTEGDLIAIIFGYAKNLLNERGYGLKMTPPTTVRGKDPAAFPPVTGPRIAIPFESDAGPFSVELRVRSA